MSHASHLPAGAHGHGSEEFDEHHWTSLGLDHMKLMFWVFLGSDCFLFGTLIGTYMSYRGQSQIGPYPLDVFSVEVTSISTFILLMSSLTMALAVRSAKTHSKVGAISMLLLTAALGFSFVAFQMYEFSHFYHSGLTLQGNLFGSTFYTLTGLHGTHVAIGVLWLLLQSLWLGSGWIRGDEGTAVEVAGLYWHFVDIVWIVIFTLVYLLEYVR
jgi:heme/copper-type cytochrome/quinol oxidase subunit 3